MRHLSTPDLIRRLERSDPDRENTDDLTFELEQRLSAQGKTFRWEQGFRGGRFSEYIVVENKASATA